MGEIIREKNIVAEKFTKSYFEVLGICCPSEVPLIEKIVKPLAGVKQVSVTVPTKTLTVVHDPLLVSQHQIVRALNHARLEASIKVKGAKNHHPKKLPSPFAVVCGILLLLSFLKFVYGPLKWLAVAAAAAGSFPLLRRAVAAVRNFTLDINILMLISVVGSIVLHDYWEAATIVFLLNAGEWLESLASHKAMVAMSSLVDVVPQRAVVAETGEEINADKVKLNTILAVKAGEVIPIDGIVMEGECEVDEKTLTGESFPVAKQKDSIVWAGTINLNGYISIKTSAIAEDCMVARMAKLVEDAQSKKSKAQRLIDKFAEYYTPAVVVISATLAIIPAALRLHNLNKWFHLALVVLVSACPCPLVLSTPVAMCCALSRAAKSGLLFKGAEYLESLAKVEVIAFDKTGTITRGEFKVTHFRSLLDGINHSMLLSWVSSIESKSSHPMAPALIDYAHSHSVESNSEKVENFQNFPGEGIYGRIDGMEIYIGNKKISTRAGCTTVPELDIDGKEGKSIGYIFLGSSLAGVFSLSDTCRTGVQEAIRKLKAMAIKIVMLTGDSYAAAKHVQEQLGGALDEFHAELLPEEKVNFVKNFQKGARTAMVGDGLNDAPALATADIGISMGVSGSALAMETGHVILMTNDIGRIPKAIELAKNVEWKIIENIVLAIFSKTAIIALAVAGHPLVWASILADVGTCLLVIFNSMLLLRGETINKRRKRCCKSSKKHKCKTTNKSSHVNRPCCSKSETRKTCKSQRCSVKKCAPKFHTSHFDSWSWAFGAGNHNINSIGKKCAPSCSSKVSISRCHSRFPNKCHDEHDCHSHANPQSCCKPHINALTHVANEKIHADCSHDSSLHKHEQPKPDKTQDCSLSIDECCHIPDNSNGIEAWHICDKNGGDGEEHCGGSSKLANDHFHDCLTHSSSHEYEHSKSNIRYDCSALDECCNHVSDVGMDEGGICDHKDHENNCESSSSMDIGAVEASKIDSTGKEFHIQHEKHVDCIVLKALENRRVGGGCCKSFKNECCDKRNQFGGSLPEIVIE